MSKMRNLTIYKWTLPITDVIDITMPQGAQILCIQVQHEEPQMWAAVEPWRPPVTRRLVVVGTGHQMPAGLAGGYVGTFQTHEGAFVGHVFDAGETT